MLTCSRTQNSKASCKQTLSFAVTANTCEFLLYESEQTFEIDEMFSTGRLVGAVIGRTVRNFTQRSAAVSQPLLGLSSGGGEYVGSTSGQAPLSAPVTQAPSASLVNAVSRRLRWDRCSHHAASIQPFIREKHVAHPAVWEEVLTVDDMKTRLCRASKASRVPYPKIVHVAERQSPNDTAELSQDMDTPVHRSETSVLRRKESQKISVRPVKSLTQQEAKKAHAKVQGILDLAVANSVHGGKRSWNRAEDRVLGAYMVHLAASEVVLTLRLEDEADKLDVKKKKRGRLENFQNFLRSMGELMSIWHSGE